MGKTVRGEFSSVAGSGTRRMYDKDGKFRHKDTLKEAFRSIARAN